MLTKFGTIMRKIRVQHSDRILDMAAKTGETCADISAIEHGEKPIPAKFIDTLIKAYGLTATQTEKLRQAARC